MERVYDSKYCGPDRKSPSHASRVKGKHVVKFYVIYENRQHHNNIDVKNQTGMHMAAPVRVDLNICDSYTHYAFHVFSPVPRARHISSPRA